jgi:SM-20-related protein
VSRATGEGTLARLGVLTREDFLEPELCAQLREEMRSARAEPATIRLEGGDYKVDEGIRRTRRVNVAKETIALVERRLHGAREGIAEASGVGLSGLQELQFVIYAEGDYFRRHVDRPPDPDDQHHSRDRAMSAILFLNGQSDDPVADEYAGGALAFYEPWEPDDGPVPVELAGREGMLVAFPPSVLHEVMPVTRGERFTVVSWFTSSRTRTPLESAQE